MTTLPGDGRGGEGERRPQGRGESGGHPQPQLRSASRRWGAAFGRRAALFCLAGSPSGGSGSVVNDGGTGETTGVRGAPHPRQGCTGRGGTCAAGGGEAWVPGERGRTRGAGGGSPRAPGGPASRGREGRRASTTGGGGTGRRWRRVLSPTARHAHWRWNSSAASHLETMPSQEKVGSCFNRRDPPICPFFLPAKPQRAPRRRCFAEEKAGAELLRQAKGEFHHRRPGGKAVPAASRRDGPSSGAPADGRGDARATARPSPPGGRRRRAMPAGRRRASVATRRRRLCAEQHRNEDGSRHGRPALLFWRD